MSRGRAVRSLAAGAGTRFGGRQAARRARRPPAARARGRARCSPCPRSTRSSSCSAHDADAIRAQVDLGGAEVVVCEDWADGQAASLRPAWRRSATPTRSRHARRPAVHHAAGDRRRARPPRPATTPSARPTTARPATRSLLGAARCSTASASSRATPARATLLERASRVRRGRPGTCATRPTSTRREELGGPADEARAVLRGAGADRRRSGTR